MSCFKAYILYTALAGWHSCCMQAPTLFFQFGSSYSVVAFNIRENIYFPGIHVKDLGLTLYTVHLQCTYMYVFAPFILWLPELQITVRWMRLNK